MISFLKRRPVYHIFIWLLMLLFFVFISFENTDEYSLSSSIQDSLTSILPMMMIVYINFFLKAAFLDKRKYLFYGLGLIALIVAGSLLFEFMKSFGLFLYNNIYQHISNVVVIIAGSTGLQYLKRGIINQYQFQELRVKTVENELNALKAQLNPHFLFNTLNNIYGINQINSDTGSEMIMELSQVMRYHLESSKAGRVSLRNEINLLESYIKLEKLRLPDQCDVSFEMDNISQNSKIAPLILLPFVENAFKHGTHSTQASFVKIICRMEEKQFFFKVQNSLIQNKNVIKTNIGLENTKRRLEIIYGKDYSLDIVKSEEEYSVDLKLTLER